MQRVLTYSGALPRVKDILNTNKYALINDSLKNAALLGSSTVVSGLACTPTIPASLQVNVAGGVIYEIDEIDATAYGDLGVDTNSVVKQANVLNTTTLTITPPTTSGFSQVFLVQVALQDIDAGAITLNYFNSVNPAQPLAGPAGSGQPQFTERQCNCVIALKAGVAATTGTQTTPAADVGFTGLYAITVANGASTVTSGNIVPVTIARPVSPTLNAPFFTTLPLVPGSVQDNTWRYATDTSAGGAPFATNGSTSTSSAVLHFASVPAWVVAGMVAFDVTTPGAITGGQTVLSTTGTTVTLSGNVNATVNSSDTIAFSNNAYVASIAPIPPALVPGISVKVKLNSTNTGAATFNLNGLGAVSVKRGTLANLIGGDLYFGQVVELVYDGTQWQVQNFDGIGAGSTITNTATTVSIPYAVDTSTTANTVLAAPTPSLGSYAAGYTIEVKIANTNIGASTLNVSGLGAVSITTGNGALTYAQLEAGHVSLFVYNGTTFDLINPNIPTLTGNTNWYVNGSTGSDTLYDGTSATISGSHGPWATIQHAVNTISPTNLAGFNQTINVADGTYNQATSLSLGTTNGNGTIFIIGDTVTPTNCFISSTAQTAPVVSAINISGGNWNIQGFEIGAGIGTVSSDPGSCIFLNGQANLSISNIAFGNANSAHIDCAGSSNVNISGIIYLVSNAQFAYHMAAIHGTIGTQGGSAPALVINGPVAVTQDFVLASQLGVVQVLYSSIANANLVSGRKFAAILNGVINTQGSGANYFPGTLGGLTGTGGQYL